MTGTGKGHVGNFMSHRQGKLLWGGDAACRAEGSEREAGGAKALRQNRASGCWAGGEEGLLAP